MNELLRQLLNKGFVGELKEKTKKPLCLTNSVETFQVVMGSLSTSLSPFVGSVGVSVDRLQCITTALCHHTQGGMCYLLQGRTG